MEHWDKMGCYGKDLSLLWYHKPLTTSHDLQPHVCLLNLL